MHLNDSSNDSVDVIVENMTKAFLDMLNKHAPIKVKEFDIRINLHGSLRILKRLF